MVIYWKNIKCRLGLKNAEVVLDDRYITTKVKSYKDEIKVGLSPSKKNLCYLLDWKPFKNDGKCFFFTLKSSFCSQDINSQVFVTTFCSSRKNGLIINIRLTSKFMTSQPGLQTIAIHIFPNISKSKGNQTMRFSQLIEYNKKNIFLQKLCRKLGKETSSRPLFIF